MKDKLKFLMGAWTMHTALPVAWLKERGFSKSLIQKYVSSGWLVSLGYGVVKRPYDTLDWSGFLWGVCKNCTPST